MLKVTTDGDKEFLIKVLSTFLTNNKESLSNMQASVKTGNQEDIGNYAHKMLSSYKHLEVNTLIEVLTKLEGLSMGFKLGKQETKELVNYLSLYSASLYQEIEKEIEQIRNE
jgi:hypothetical protein